MTTESSGKISGTPTFLRTPSVSRNCKREGRAMSVIIRWAFRSQGRGTTRWWVGIWSSLALRGLVSEMGREKGLCIASKKTETILQIGGWRRDLGPSCAHVIRRCLIWGLCTGIWLRQRIRDVLCNRTRICDGDWQGIW
jgi:hypothetical protein